MASRNIEESLKELAADLTRLRDELRVRLHLAGMDARDRWRELEPKLGQVDRLAQDASESSRKMLAELRDKARELLAKIGKDEKTPAPPAV